MRRNDDLQLWLVGGEPPTPTGAVIRHSTRRLQACVVNGERVALVGRSRPRAALVGSPRDLQIG